MKELEDLNWFPQFLRVQQTEFIGWMVRFFGVYNTVPRMMAEKIPAKLRHTIWDLGSGSGGPLQTLAKDKILEDSSFVLSDLFPQIDARLPANCHYHAKPMDARNESPGKQITITFFNAFHHFKAAEQDGIVKRELNHGNALLVAEILQPDFLCTLRILLATTIGQVLFAPWVRPFRLNRLLFTWLVPVNLFTVTWDGLVSVLKSPGTKDYTRLAAVALSAGGRAEIQRTGSFLTPVNVVVFLPPSMPD